MSGILGDDVRRVLLTGGAGFIGSHVVDTLLPQGYDITVIDNLSNGRLQFIERHLGNPRFTFIEADVLDATSLAVAMAGQDLVWHLAANTDIIGSHEQPSRDLRDCTEATFRVLDAMRTSGVRNILFASTGAVYGDICRDVAVSEAAGPLLPVSTYGAGKIGSEAFISAFCSVYGLRGWIFRFGNVVGARMTHGVIYDFINKFRENPRELLVRGDGRQEKNYFLVEECIDGMAFAFRNLPLSADRPCEILNLGTSSVTRVMDLAALVREEMGLADATIVVEGASRAWPGDQPRVHFTVGRIGDLGWKTRYSSDESVRIATRRMLGTLSPLGVL